MQRQEWRWIDKHGWGDGPWQSEPDKRQWQDEATGLPCLIRRNERMGFICGYVGVPPGHALYGKSSSEVDLSAHCDVNYAAPCMEDHEHGICHIPEPGEPDSVWWFGFDCGHAGDHYPRLAALIGREIFNDPHDEYRDFAYVTEQCRELAAQLAAQAAEPRTNG